MQQKLIIIYQQKSEQEKRKKILSNISEIYKILKIVYKVPLCDLSKTFIFSKEFKENKVWRIQDIPYDRMTTPAYTQE